MITRIGTMKKAKSEAEEDGTLTEERSEPLERKSEGSQNNSMMVVFWH